MKRRKLFSVIGWVGLAALLCGVAALGVAVWHLSRTLLTEAGYIRTEAVVVDIAEVRTSIGVHNKTLYAEVAEYSVGGVTYTAQNSSASTAPKKIGSTITVAYNPDNPEIAFFRRQIIRPLLWCLCWRQGLLRQGECV